MFTLIKVAALVLAVSMQVNAHTAVSPVLGLAGEPARSDVKRPNARNPCGRNVDIASAMAASTPVQAAADGTFTMTATNFNRLFDGSRQMTAKVDPAATGQFTGDVTMVQNGQRAPAQLGSEQVVASLPPGTQCTGGATKDKCLVQFKNLVGFGNCVVVQQAGGATATPATDADPEDAADDAAAGTAAAGTAATGAAAGGAATGATAAKAGKAGGLAAILGGGAAGGRAGGAGGLLKALRGRSVGSRLIGRSVAPRELVESLDALEARLEKLELESRSFMDWVWA